MALSNPIPMSFVGYFNVVEHTPNATASEYPHRTKIRNERTNDAEDQPSATDHH